VLERAPVVVRRLHGDIPIHHVHVRVQADAQVHDHRSRGIVHAEEVAVVEAGIARADVVERRRQLVAQCLVELGQHRRPTLHVLHWTGDGRAN
jgi:hypothetical protein